jgi:hypothetical protein
MDPLRNVGRNSNDMVFGRCLQLPAAEHVETAVSGGLPQFHPAGESRVQKYNPDSCSVFRRGKLKAAGMTAGPVVARVSVHGIATIARNMEL